MDKTDWIIRHREAARETRHVASLRTAHGTCPARSIREADEPAVSGRGAKRDEAASARPYR
jgi:hypothetical protein